MVLQKSVEELTEFILISLWDSRESIRKFAGEPVDKPVYYPEDSEYLLSMEERVEHYDIVYNHIAE